MKQRHLSYLINVVLIALLLMSAGVRSLEAAESGEPPYEFDSYTRMAPNREVTDGPGKIAITENETTLSRCFKLFDQLPLKLSLKSLFININKSVPSALPARLTGVSFDAEATLPFFHVDKMALIVGVSPSFQGEDWEFQRANFRVPFRMVMVYQPNEQWVWTGGVAFYPRYQDALLPVIGFDYHPNKFWEFDINSDNPKISYALNNKITLFMEGNFTLEEFVVDRDSVSHSVVLRYAKTDIGAGVQWKINPDWTVAVSLGETMDNSLRYKDNKDKTAINNGLYDQIGIEARF